MTYQNQYSLKSTQAHNINGATLYEAVQALKAAAKKGDIQDASRIMRGDRFVAFYCSWRNEIRPAFQANQQERDVLTSWL